MEDQVSELNSLILSSSKKLFISAGMHICDSCGPKNCKHVFAPALEKHFYSLILPSCSYFQHGARWGRL